MNFTSYGNFPDMRAPLAKASLCGLDKLCEQLIKDGCDINESDPEGNTALHIAALHGHRNIYDLLVTYGADINIENNIGETPWRLYRENEEINQ